MSKIINERGKRKVVLTVEEQHKIIMQFLREKHAIVAGTVPIKRHDGSIEVEVI